MQLLDRFAWGATAGLGPAMQLPAQGVHVHHSVTAPGPDVAADMRELEAIGVDRFGRFSYSFCGHPSGWVGEGAGLTVGAHTAGWNSTTFGFCLIGNYEAQLVTDAQVRAFVEWRAWMVEAGWLVPGHWIVPHQTRTQTACPGVHTLERWPELIGHLPVPEEDDLPYTEEQLIGVVREAMAREVKTPNTQTQVALIDSIVREAIAREFEDPETRTASSVIDNLVREGMAREFEDPGSRSSTALRAMFAEVLAEQPAPDGT